MYKTGKLKTAKLVYIHKLRGQAGGGGYVPQCPIAGDANGLNVAYRKSYIGFSKNPLLDP